MTDNTYVYVNEFLDYLKIEKGSSQKTVASYKIDLRDFFKVYEVDYNIIQKEDIYKYIEDLKSKFKHNTVQRKISSLKSFYKFLYLNKYILKDPTNTIKLMKKQKRLPTVLTEEEFKQIIDTFNHNPKSIRDKLILQLLIATGARISEIIELNIADIKDNDYKYIRVFGKGSKYRMIPIYKEIGEEIKRFIENERNLLVKSKRDFRIFTGSSRTMFYKTFKEHAKQAGIEKNVHPHTIRHSIATMLLKNGADIRMVQEILGHSSITTTELYTHIEKSKLKSIYDNIKIGDDDGE